MHTLDWRPTASRQAIKARADIQRQIRAFFNEQDVLEVETPLLCRTGVTDLHLVNAVTYLQGQGLPDRTPYYLQTSPEYPMKRLLAAGIGDCFQISKVVRDEELSLRHNFEFSMLEWYRLGFDDQALMSEVEELFKLLLGTMPVRRISYQQAFIEALAVDPLVASRQEIAEAIRAKGIDCDVVAEDKDGLLNLAMSLIVEPHFPQDTLTFVYHFPSSQAVLARKNENDPRVAHRFEAFYQGLELANGFWELTDAMEQRQRFIEDNQKRRQAGLEEVPVDERLLAALAHGLPDCSGVAVGVDRLLMIKLGVKNIKEVVTFPSLLA
ncbi:elongation factor P lysine(34) lysyltransferase [Aliidiomarina taiwanensis]|uniref:Elongation factor P lysine(34) lysyltransferase n=1 Tax=Aliidiomarina taiwanensis TaxID=946228 RepID=A0A432WYJ4_9GAMM|nr:EF-P lysine aminoacylase EpmA [Aliidiomarina taiwanensis]RUO38868.1 elongation factor P lysine(34) lysyltransferase [Aliidiomarina taiwanensis]